jgi:hypothetical protein
VSQAHVVAGPQTTRSEAEVAADTVAAIFGAKLLTMDRHTISEVSFATRLPVSAIKAGWERREAGYWRPASSYPCQPASEFPPRPQRQNKGNRNPSRVIPDDAIEWVCKRKDCPHGGKAQPVACFKPRFESRRDDSGKYLSRRTICDDCRKRDQRRHYLTVEQSDRLGVLLRFVVKTGDVCVDAECGRCHGPMLVGQEVETDRVAVHHAECPG